MKLQVDGTDVFELAPWQEKVLKYILLSEGFEEDMKRRARYIWEHKFEQCYKRLREEWEPKLIEEGAQSLPTSQEEFANLVFAHPDYKSRSQREAENES